MDTREIRELFTRFFEQRGHQRVPSSSLIPPPEERTILFTTAGMAQMKPYFMGLARPPATRMTSIQKCFRTSDIEEVGDQSHCTFFEMLGNFSVGDYFKAEVIPWAWELLTSKDTGLGLSPDRIWPTIFQDDEEAFDIWHSLGIPEERIRRYGEDKNYWFMGRVGPCGPNTEIFYDFGARFGCLRPECHPNCDEPMANGQPCNRYIELWNLVFMTLYQSEDGSRRPLPQRNVDTGGGLERWPMAWMFENGVDWQGNPKTWDQPPTIYDADGFQEILRDIERHTTFSYADVAEHRRRAMRIVAEHTRAACMLLADGVTPSNEGRGYVLRRLIRRAVYYSRKDLISNISYLERVSRVVGGVLSQQYPNLLINAEFIARTLREEENRFAETRGRGESAIEALAELDGHMRAIIRSVATDPQSRYNYASRPTDIAGVIMTAALPDSIKQPFVTSLRRQLGESWWEADSEKLVEIADQKLAITGETAFVLWDTFGFPPELTREVATEHGLDVDLSAFETLMEAQRTRSRAGGHFEGDAERIQTYAELGLAPTEFVGYEDTRANSIVSAILLNGTTVVRTLTPALAAQHRVEVVLDHTPFYAEGGGQVGDRGEIVWPGGQFTVDDTQAVGDGGVVAHIGHLEAGELSVNDFVEARVNEDVRADIMRNHTATHILHAALRNVLGTHARQAGSLVTPDRLRFDFTNLEAMTPDQIRQVELLANKAVRENLPVSVDYLSYEDALEGGALAFFGDKYANTVRVVGICDDEADRCFSKELCGGTHVHASGDVGSIIVTAETSIGAGLRRIEAVTGRAAAERIRQQEETLARLGASLNAPAAEIETRLATMREENDRLRRQIQTMERRMASMAAAGASSSADSTETAIAEKDNVVVEHVPDAPNIEFLLAMGDAYKQRYKSAAVLLGALIDGKPAFVAMSTPDVAPRVAAGDVVRVASREAGGNGGGRPESARGGGTDPAKLDAALAAGRKLIEEKLASS